MIRNGEKRSVYMPDEMYTELAKEADRQDRSISWLVQQAWRIAKGTLGKMPGTEDRDRGAEHRDEGGS